MTISSNLTSTLLSSAILLKALLIVDSVDLMKLESIIATLFNFADIT
ncbi:hypothetical protein IKE96_02640 [bacterium]|nr:hypothetical protein [bacterium]